MAGPGKRASKRAVLVSALVGGGSAVAVVALVIGLAAHHDSVAPERAAKVKAAAPPADHATSLSIDASTGSSSDWAAPAEHPTSAAHDGSMDRGGGSPFIDIRAGAPASPAGVLASSQPMQSLSSWADLSVPTNESFSDADNGSSMPAAPQGSFIAAAPTGPDLGVVAAPGPLYAPSIAAPLAAAAPIPLATATASQPGVYQLQPTSPAGPSVLANTAVAPIAPVPASFSPIFSAATPPQSVAAQAAPAVPLAQPALAGPSMASPPPVAVQGTSPQNPLMPAGGGLGPDLLACAAPNCQSEGWTYFDPKVAIGYDFALQPSGLTAASVGVTDIRVSTKVGDGDYQLYLLDTSGAWIDVAPIDANPDGVAADDFNVASFLGALTLAEDQEFGITDPADGLTQFSIRGIDPAAGLDPNDPQAFIAGLEFSDWFQGNVLITPLVLDTATGIDPPGTSFKLAVPEPPMLPVFAAGLLGMALLRRRVVARPVRRR